MHWLSRSMIGVLLKVWDKKTVSYWFLHETFHKPQETSFYVFNVSVNYLCILCLIVSG